MLSRISDVSASALHAFWNADIMFANDGDGDDVGAHRHTESRRMVRGGCLVNDRIPS